MERGRMSAQHRSVFMLFENATHTHSHSVRTHTHSVNGAPVVRYRFFLFLGLTFIS